MLLTRAMVRVLRDCPVLEYLLLYTQHDSYSLTEISVCSSRVLLLQPRIYCNRSHDAGPTALLINDIRVGETHPIAQLSIQVSNEPIALVKDSQKVGILQRPP
jgi:hypothetical protein